MRSDGTTLMARPFHLESDQEPLKLLLIARRIVRPRAWFVSCLIKEMFNNAKTMHSRP